MFCIAKAKPTKSESKFRVADCNFTNYCEFTFYGHPQLPKSNPSIPFTHITLLLQNPTFKQPKQPFNLSYLSKPIKTKLRDQRGKS